MVYCRLPYLTLPSGASSGLSRGIKARLSCASKFGQARSIGAAFGSGAVANFLGGNAVSSLTNVELGLLASTSVGLGLPTNDVLRLAGQAIIPAMCSPGGSARTSVVTSMLNSFLGTDSSIVSLSGETSVVSSGDAAVTAAYVAETASAVALAKFGYDGLAVAYGYAFGCSE